MTTLNIRKMVIGVVLAIIGLPVVSVLITVVSFYLLFEFTGIDGKRPDPLTADNA